MSSTSLLRARGAHAHVPVPYVEPWRTPSLAMQLSTIAPTPRSRT